MITPVKIGLIGSGCISYTYLKNLTETFFVTDVAGCSDLIAERSAARAKQFSIRAMTNDEILSDSDIQIVVNTTNIPSHYEVTAAALSAGKHVYTEKMMSTGFSSAKELVEMASQRGLRIGTAPDTFLGAGLQTARKLLDAGLIGEPFAAQAMIVRGVRLAGADRPGSQPMSEGTGIPFDMGGYYIYALIHMLGPVKRVTGFCKAFRQEEMWRNPRHPDYRQPVKANTPSLLNGALEFCNGCYANLTVIGESHHKEIPRLEIYGTDGTLILPDPNTFTGPVYLIRGTDANVEELQMPLTHAYGYKSAENPAMPKEYNDWRDSYRGIGVADMAWAILNDRPHRCSAELGLHAMEIIHGIETSCRDEIIYTMTSRPAQPQAIPAGYIYGDAAEACLDTR